MLSYAEALELILKAAEKLSSHFLLQTEKVVLEKAVGRICAQNLLADRDYPPFNRSQMDGFAISVKDLEEIAKSGAQILTSIDAGVDPRKLARKLQSRGGKPAAVKIHTGAIVPPEFDAVIKLEDTYLENDLLFFNNDFSWRELPKNNFISLYGEDLKKKQCFIRAGHKIKTSDIAILASTGFAHLTVIRPPVITVLSNGNELVDIRKIPKEFQIRDSNYYAIAALLRQHGFTKINYILTRDNEAEILQSLKRALKSDLIIVSGGISRGEKDLLAGILHKINIRETFHRVNIKPGMPVWFGQGKKNPRKIVFSLPGNSFSALTTCRMFVIPFLYRLYRQSFDFKEQLSLQQQLRRGKRPEFFPAVIFENGTKKTLQTKKVNSSGDVTAVTNSDGLIFLDEDISELAAGSLTNFIPW